jgi:hypothetical protein
VDADAPERDPARPVEAVVDSLLNQQQAELMKELWSRMSPKQREQLMASDDIA